MPSVELEQRGHVLLVTLNRPEALNALDYETYVGLQQCWNDFRDDDDLRVAVVTGAGDKAFCAGSDLKDIAPRINDGTLDKSMVDQPLLEGVDLYKPVVAAVNGYALGAGFELVMACDVAVASDNAQFGLPEVRWGRLPGYGLARLPRSMPRKLALEMILTGERITATEAHRRGLVNHVTPREDLLPKALELAEAMASLSPLALQAAKEVTIRGMELTQAGAQTLTDEVLKARIYPSHDAAEGALAFKEKRAPVWQGR